MIETQLPGFSVEGNGSPNSGPGPLDAPETYYRELIEFTADAVISIDVEGRVELFNTAAERLFGFEREEVIGQNIKMLMPEPYRGQHDSYLERYQRTGEVKILDRWREVEGQRKDGTRMPIEIGVREFWVEGRRVFTGIVRDLSALKAAQRESQDKSQDILELSTPAISVWRDVLVLPLIGTLDSRRMKICTERTLTRMSEERARVLILDITGLPVIDTMVANSLIQLTAAVRLMGGHSILTGISPSTAMTIIGLGVDLSTLSTRSTLQQGLKLAIELTDRPIGD